MNAMDERVITYAGIGQAIAILNRDGLLNLEVPPSDVRTGLAVLDTKATTFLRESRERGDARNKEELDEAYLIACFKLWIEGHVKLVTTAEA